jgi:hypothetical protein
MIRKLVLIILASALLSLVLVAVCNLFFPDALPYAAGEGDAASWQRQIAFLITATAWTSAEASGLFAIVLGAILWRRRASKAS